VKPHTGPIVGKRVTLRLLEQADLSMTREWRNKDRVRMKFVTTNKLEPDSHQRWFEQYLLKDDDYLFVIEETDALKKPVGQIGMYNIDRSERKAEYGRLMIGEENALGLGIAAEASRLMIEHFSKNFGIDKVYLEVKADNESAYKLYESLGFERTGEHENLVAMSLKAPAVK